MSNTARLSARDRIDMLLDDNSFAEIGAAVTGRNTDFDLQKKTAPGDGVITGYGVIDQKLVYVFSQDSSVLGGSMGEMHARKICRLYELAGKVGAPVIGLYDCTGLRLEEATDALDGFGAIYQAQAMASGVIPQFSGVFGTCGGGVAICAAMSDVSFMTKENAHLFVNSPNAIAGNFTGKEDTAAGAFQASCGNVDQVFETEEELLSGLRELIAVLPNSNEENDSFDECTDDLNRTLPSFSGEIQDPALALVDISDDGFFFEMKKEYAKEMVTGFLRLNGVTVGAVANRRELLGEDGKPVEKYDAGLTSEGCKKAAKFVSFCDAFSIPILTLTNVNGYRATKCEEKNIAIAAASLTYAFANASVAKVNVVTGEAFGSAYVSMNSRHIGADMVFALPNAKIGTMDAALAASVMYDSNDGELVRQKAKEYDTLQNSAQSAAARGYVDAVISPESVRAQLIYAFEMLFAKEDSRPVKKHGTIQ